MEKVANASGSRYSGGETTKSASAATPAPPLSSKPAFTPTRVGGSNFRSLVSRPRPDTSNTGPVDEDGWGADAPPVTRTQLQKVDSSYQPTKVNMNELTYRGNAPSRISNSTSQNTSDAEQSDVVRGGYQPVGKVDIAAIRRQAKESGSTTQNDRPTIVKGAYEPVGKVDIASIRARAQPSSQPTRGGGEDTPELPSSKPSVQSHSERLTTLPRPKVANKLSSNASSFMGTKPPTPGGFGAKPIMPSAPVGTASRTFADEGGKTPSQLWAEKKARERGNSGVGNTLPSSTPSGPTSPIPTQKSGGGEGGWKSGYTGKSWAPVKTTRTGQSTGTNASDNALPNQQEQQTEDRGVEEPKSPTSSGGINAIRDRFKGAMPMGAPVPAEQHVALPTPPAQPPRSPSPETPPPVHTGSPIQIAMPVGRSGNDADNQQISNPEMHAPSELHPEPAVPVRSVAQVADTVQDRISPEPQIQEEDPAQHAAEIVAHDTFGPDASVASGKRALIQYDYEKAEDNELELREGEYVTDIDMVDTDWWMGRNERGEVGLFPSNYVELVDDSGGASAGTNKAAATESASAAAATATALYDYDAVEDNELSFPDGAKITDVVSYELHENYEMHIFFKPIRWLTWYF